jgi:hypothetical protein
MLYAGVPAIPIKSVEGAKYLVREKGFVER